MPVQVKICGLTRPEDVEAVNAAGADYAGFVFFEKSRRNLDFETAAGLLAGLDPAIRSVAVCVSPGEELLSQIETLGFDVIQIHGEIAEGLLDSVGTPVWQAVNLSDRAQLGTIRQHPRICGYVIDGAEYGSGKPFVWEGAEEIRQALGGRTFILAGGLDPDNVRTAIRLLSPDVVDVSSGVERLPGESPGCGREDGTGTGPAKNGGKDRDKIFRFISEVREG